MPRPHLCELRERALELVSRGAPSSMSQWRSGSRRDRQCGVGRARGRNMVVESFLARTQVELLNRRRWPPKSRSRTRSSSASKASTHAGGATAHSAGISGCSSRTDTVSTPRFLIRSSGKPGHD